MSASASENPTCNGLALIILGIIHTLPLLLCTTVWWYMYYYLINNWGNQGSKRFNNLPFGAFGGRSGVDPVSVYATSLGLLTRRRSEWTADDVTCTRKSAKEWTPLWEKQSWKISMRFHSFLEGLLHPKYYFHLANRWLNPFPSKTREKINI